MNYKNLKIILLSLLFTNVIGIILLFVAVTDFFRHFNFLKNINFPIISLIFLGFISLLILGTLLINKSVITLIFYKNKVKQNK